MTSDMLTIGETAKRAGVKTSALRFYESEGLIVSDRTDGNQRRFHRSTLRRIAIIKAAQGFGLTLTEIAEAMSTLPDGRVPTSSDWKRLSKKWLARVDTEIARLQAFREQATSCIGCGCLSLENCGIFNPSDELAERGPGADKLERPSTS